MKGFFKNGNPVIELLIEEEKIDVEIDTGFNGCLMLSRTLIDKFHLELYGSGDYIAANGETVVTEIYKGKIKFLDEEKEVEVLSTAGDFALAGMELFHECKIVIERHRNIVEVIKTH